MGGEIVTSSVITGLSVYNVDESYFTGSDDEISNPFVKKALNNWSWWWPFNNYEIPFYVGPNLKSDNSNVDTKFFQRFLIAGGYQFGYFPKGGFPLGMRASFVFQSEIFTAMMPWEEEFFHNSKSIMMPGGELFIRIGNYTTKRYNVFLIGGVQYKKVINFKKKQFEKPKFFSFKKDKYKYEKQDKKSLNNGMAGNFGIGLINTRTGRMVSITYQKDFFDFFNTDYTTPDGAKPYKGFTSNNGFISVNINFVP